MKFFSIFLLLIIIVIPGISQDSLKAKRLKPLVITSAAAYTGTMVALSNVWYDKHEKTSFHFFNDNSEWQQMDKVGHIYTAYHLSSISYEGLKWSGLNGRKAAFYGAAAGLLMILPVELLDGYSAKYGASVGDIIADFAGAGLFLAQHQLWGEGRIIPKFSFHQTPYANLRPEVLGKGFSEEWLKDYNGQTYWLSFDTDKFFPSEKRWLHFINIAVGYGMEGMVYAREKQNQAQGFSSYRQYYLALDLDLSAIQTNKKWLKSILYVINMIHIPAPTLSYGNNEVKFQWFYN